MYNCICCHGFLFLPLLGSHGLLDLLHRSFQPNRRSCKQKLQHTTNGFKDWTRLEAEMHRHHKIPCGISFVSPFNASPGIRIRVSPCRCLEDFQAFFSAYLGILVVDVGMIACVAGFRVQAVSDLQQQSGNCCLRFLIILLCWQSTNMEFSFWSAFLCCIDAAFFLGIYCVCSGMLTFECVAISETIYDCRWFDCPLKLRPMLQLMLAKSQRPFYFSGFGMYILTMESFTIVGPVSW